MEMIMTKPSECPNCPGPHVVHQHYATGGLDALREAQDYHSRLGFTQRDVDPLGKGHVAQRQVDPVEDVLGPAWTERMRAEWERVDPEGVAALRRSAAAYQASDQAKRDENVLRSAER